MILSIETSTLNLSLTLLINNQVINKVSIQIKNELSEIIIPTSKLNFPFSPSRIRLAERSLSSGSKAA